MPGVEVNGASKGSQSSAKESKDSTKKLVLFFDGTGNTFSGTDSDTNVVKLLRKLDRNHEDQYHYYQTGIGTYDVNVASVNKTFLGGIRSSVMKTVDQGVGTTFDSHVMAGYRFLMQYYVPGAKIYMFGFSRGAFTAKFLARMVNTVGLLCKGNEEMIPFVYQLYQNKILGKNNDQKTEPKDDTSALQSENRTVKCCPGCKACKKSLPHEECACDDGDKTVRKEDSEYDQIRSFSRTFCRRDPKFDDANLDELKRNVKVYFLGMWDCVSSVSVLEQTAYKLETSDTATFVRHAVAIDEHRVKFKAALLNQEIHDDSNHIKEVWFPGSHCDVGGGWHANDPVEHNHQGVNIWNRLKYFWSGSSQEYHSKKLQMSDIPLAWMINELDLVAKKDRSAGIHWRKRTIHDFWVKFRTHIDQARNAVMHNPLRFYSGTAFYKVLLWKFMEYFPIATRLECNDDDEWKDVRLPPNMQNARDIPLNAEFHESVLWRLSKPELKYAPINNHGGSSGSKCLDKQNLEEFKESPDPWAHNTYRFHSSHLDKPELVRRRTTKAKKS